MSVVAIYSPKGGVGKTTIAVDMAWRSAGHGQRKTLLWDLDTEGGAGFLVDASDDLKIRSSQFLERPLTLTAHLQETARSRLSYVGLSSDLKELSTNLQRLGPRQRLREAIAYTESSYERVILDCPPLRNEISDQLLAAADLLIVPLPVSPLAARALDHVRSDVATIGRKNLPILPVFSMYNSRRASHRAALDDWMKSFPMVPYSSLVEQVSFQRRPIFSFAANSDASAALERLWRGVEKRILEDQNRFRTISRPSFSTVARTPFQPAKVRIASAGR